MRALLITDKNVSLFYSGAQLMTNRNYLSLTFIFGNKNVDVMQLEFLAYSKKSKKLLNLIRGYNDFLNPEIVKDVIRKADNYAHIFLDFSTWGIITKRLKKNGYKGKTYCFFHNCEFSYLWQENRFPSLINLVKLYNVFLNEKLSCKYSDKIIALNERDSHNILRYYKKKPDLIIPISLVDGYKNPSNTDIKVEAPYNLLFFGSYFWANAKGILWFVENVLPFVDNITLTIAGNGMNNLKDKINCDKVILYDMVEDLRPLIEGSDFILCPIFEGSGMKVKTATALMYGKNIIGTIEAFIGYDLDFKKVGALCSTKKEFIDFFKSDSINKLNKFNSYSRNQFILNHSFEATLKQFKKLLDT